MGQCLLQNGLFQRGTSHWSHEFQLSDGQKVRPQLESTLIVSTLGFSPASAVCEAKTQDSNSDNPACFAWVPPILFWRRYFPGGVTLSSRDRGTLKALQDQAIAAVTASQCAIAHIKHLQQGIEWDHFCTKKNMPKIGRFQVLKSARRPIACFEATLWLKKGFGSTGDWTANEQSDLLMDLLGLQKDIRA
jgi:hypothetical protein